MTDTNDDKNQETTPATPLDPETPAPPPTKWDATPLAAQIPFQMPAPLPSSSGLPSWVKMPAGMKAPRGKMKVWILCKAHLTERPEMGDRCLTLWSLSDGEERQAMDRCGGESMRLSAELAKGMIRAVNELRANWEGPGSPGSVDDVWEEIGPRYRSQVTRAFSRMHAFNQKEQDDFFENCVIAQSSG